MSFGRLGQGNKPEMKIFSVPFQRESALAALYAGVSRQREANSVLGPLLLGRWFTPKFWTPVTGEGGGAHLLVAGRGQFAGVDFLL